MSFSIFISILHVENVKLSVFDFFKALILSFFELTILRTIVLIARFSAFIGYKKQKKVWDKADRRSFD